IVNTPDLDLIRASINKTRGQAGFNANADVNFDGRVDNADLLLVSRNIGKKYPATPPPPAPTIVATAAPAANANGWNTTDVVVSFVCTNATSCPTLSTVSSEGANQLLQRTVQNTAGASATASVT